MAHPSGFSDRRKEIDAGSYLLGKDIQTILHDPGTIMSNLAKLTADLAAAKKELDEVRDASAADQQTDAQLVADRDATIVQKDATIADLQSQLADAATPEERAALEQSIADLRTEIAEIKSGITPAGQ